jgi:hypothetical protein
MKKTKLFETMRECGREIWLYETNQIPYNETELQQLKTIEENILVYLETTLQKKRRNYNSANGNLVPKTEL